MRPMELSCITEVWKSALKIVGENLANIGTDLQLWFPWGRIWRGHDLIGALPATELPSELVENDTSRFGGRLWKSVSIGQYFWLLSVKAPKTSLPEMQEFKISEKAIESLKMLGEFVRLESILAISMKVLENRANEHTGHWDRVTGLSVAIGEELGLSKQELADLEIAALLHDIGKVALPDKILDSSEKLNEEDKKQMESHSIIGATMVREAPGMDKIADYILFHHESPDGSGYPYGKTENEIPLGAQIIAVADSFDAMTHYRPYANEKTYLETFNEMKKTKGKFSPIVLEALEKVLTKLGILQTKPMVTETCEK